MLSHVLSIRIHRRSRIVALFTGLMAAIGIAMARERAAAGLSRMSDHHLRDIGISRAEIPHAVEKSNRDY